MMTRWSALLAATAFVAAAAATPAMACCDCAYTCAAPAQVAPAQVQIWGLSPQFVVNQGPVFSGPGYYTDPTFEGESLTVDYPYVGYGNPALSAPRYYRPYDGAPAADPFRHRFYHQHWEGVLPERPHHFATLSRHEDGVPYRRGFRPRAITMSGGERLVARGHRDLREPRWR
jgi:hypothetical protein